MSFAAVLRCRPIPITTPVSSNRRTCVVLIAALPALIGAGGCDPEVRSEPSRNVAWKNERVAAPSRADQQRIAGTLPPISLPPAALLAKPQDPDCASAEPSKPAPPADRPRDRAEVVPSRVAGWSTAARLLPAQSAPNDDLAQRIRIEYERECFRLAEQRARQRLERLQAAVRETIRDVRRAEQARAE